MDAFWVQVGNHAQVGDLGLALKCAGAVIGPGGDVGLRHARFQRAAGHGCDVGQRAVAGLGGGNQLARNGHRVGDHAAYWVVGAGRAAGADAKELLGLRGAGEGERGGEGYGPKFQFHENPLSGLLFGMDIRESRKYTMCRVRRT